MDGRGGRATESECNAVNVVVMMLTAVVWNPGFKRKISHKIGSLEYNPAGYKGINPVYLNLARGWRQDRGRALNGAEVISD